MIKERAKELLPIIQAYVEGKIVQVRISGDNWKDELNPNFNSALTWRIKPEPEYRWINLNKESGQRGKLFTNGFIYHSKEDADTVARREDYHQRVSRIKVELEEGVWDD